MEQPSFHDELQLLGRILREEQFRFVLVEYNHMNVLRQVEDFVRKAYPERPILFLTVKGNHFRRFSRQMKEFGKGIVFIPDFDELFRPENDDFRIAFNQRRDWLSQQALAMVCFLPSGGSPLVMKGMPDFWSRRDAGLSLLVKQPERVAPSFQEPRISTIGGAEAEGKIAERQRLESGIAASDPGNFSQLDNLYRQLLPLLEDLGDYKVGLSAAREYHQLVHLHDSDNVLSQQYAHQYQATFHRHLGQYSDAEYHARTALTLAEASGDEAGIASSQNNLALVLKDLGNYAEAKSLLEKAIAWAERTIGKQDAITSVIYLNLAIVLQGQNDLIGAKALLEQTTRHLEENVGADHPYTAQSYTNLGLVLKALGDLSGAERLLEKALSSVKRNFGEQHPSTAASYSNVGLVLMDQGDVARAKALLEKSRQIFLIQFGQSHPFTEKVEGWLAELDSPEASNT